MNKPIQTDPVKFALSVVWDLITKGWEIHAVETPVYILNEFGEKITHGTIDLVMERKTAFLIIDWKTGDRGDYDLQMHAYASAWMDLHPESKSISGLLVYVDLRGTVPISFDYETSSNVVLSLYEKWQHKEKHPYVINHQCHWCALRSTCPAWYKSAGESLDQVNDLLALKENYGPEFLQAKIDYLKNKPVDLEKFLLSWERARILVEDDWALKAVLKGHIQGGYKSDYFSLVTVKPKIEKSIDPEQFLTRMAYKLGAMNAAPAIKIDASKAIEAWNNFTSDPLPVQVTETEKGGYDYIRLKGKPGAGESKKLKPSA